MNGKDQPKRLTKDEINALPLDGYRGRIVRVPDDMALPDAATRWGRERVIGFDTETRPAFRKGEKYRPALMQLAGRDAVYIVDLKAPQDFGPLARLLSDGRIVKSGVALKRDVEELQVLFKFKPAGFVDLALPARELGYAQTGLRSLIALLMNFRISKQAQRTNWERRPLTEKQLRYAATDAWAGREIWLKIKPRLSERGKNQPSSQGNWY